MLNRRRTGDGSTLKPSRPTTRHCRNALWESWPLAIGLFHLDDGVIVDGQVLQTLHSDLVVQRLSVPMHQIRHQIALSHSIAQEFFVLVLQHVDLLQPSKRLAERVNLRFLQFARNIMHQDTLLNIIATLLYDLWNSNFLTFFLQ